MDGDGAHNPNEILQLYSSHIASRADLTIGNRFSESSSNKAHIPSSKIAANYFAAKIMNLSFNTKLKDVTCGFRVVRKNILKELVIKKTPKGFAIAFDTIKTAIDNDYCLNSCEISARYDATELFFTKQNELIDFLQCMLSTNNALLFRSVKAMIPFVNSLRPFSVVFPEAIICAIPISNPNGFIFQTQHLDFKNTLGETFYFL